MTRFRAVTTTAVLTALLAGGAVFAQGPNPGGGGRRGPGGPGMRGGPGGGLPIRELNLSDTQQQAIRDVRQQYQEQGRTAFEQLRTAMEAQRKAVETLPVNEGLIRSTTQAVVEAQTEVAIQQARLQSEIFALLTPAQQEQAAKLRTEREARTQQPRQRPQQQKQAK